MIIKSLEIYGYGQFVQRKIEFNQTFTEIFGENEAGKSTVQAFIHSILFGFPTKRSKEPRLEPRLGNQYGGKLTLILDDQQEIEVERIKGSAQGDVKVYLSNGSTRDEAWLQKKLNYISKSTYQGIFSFNVMGLQDIHRNMNENQLQEYLLEAGALGSTEFTSMRDLIAHKKDELYKKSGKNPIINQQIEQLKQLEGQIREEEAQLDTYHRLVDDQDKATRRLEHLKQNLSQLSKMHEDKQKEVALHDHTQEWKALEQRLNIEPLTFPEKGLDRYEKAHAYQQSLERDISLREEKLTQLKEEAETLNPIQQSHIDTINHVSKQEDDIKNKEYELTALNKEIQDKQREKEALQANIGWTETHQDVDSSEAMKNYVSELNKEQQQQSAHMAQLERNLEDNHIEYDSLEKELATLEEQVVSDETFTKKKEYTQQIIELNEKENLYEKLKERFNSEQEAKQKRQNQFRTLFIILTIIGVASTVFAFLSQNIILAVILAILTIVFIVGIFASKTKSVDYSEAITGEIDDLKHQLNNLEQDYDLDFDLDEQYRKRDQQLQAYNNKDILSEKRQRIETSLNEVKQQHDKLFKHIDNIKAELYLSDKTSNDLIIDYISTMNSIKSLDQQLTDLIAKRDQLATDLETFYNQAQQATASHFSHFNKSSLFHDIKQWLTHTYKENELYKQKNEDITLVTNELKQLKSKLAETTQEIEQLFNAVNVSSEDAFYQHHEQYQNYISELDRFNDLSKYLENQNYSYDKSSSLSEKTTAQLEEEDRLLAKQVDEYNEQYLDMQADVSDLNAQITHMETDTTLTHLRHEYHSLKNRLNDMAKDWASLSYLQSLVDEHIKQIKDKRLPQVINGAVEIFKYLTDERYTMIHYNEDTITVKHTNGQVYEPIELSQSTKEILYVSLRLSLIKVLKPYYPFPIIVDDAFVHFDQHRTQKMLNYLRELAKDYQVLYFTCVKDNIIPPKEILTLNKIEEGGKR